MVAYYPYFGLFVAFSHCFLCWEILIQTCILVVRKKVNVLTLSLMLYLFKSKEK